MKVPKKTLLIVIFSLVLLFGGFLRVYKLGEKSFWIDEATSALAARKILESGKPELSSGHMYNRARFFHTVLAGFLAFGQNEFFARLISVVFGLLSCVLAFFVGRLYNKKAGWIAFVFSVFLEIFIVYSRQARMYQFEMFFFFFTVYLLHLTEKNKKWFIGAIFSMWISYNTHLVGILLAPVFVYYLWDSKVSKWWIVPGVLVLGFFTYRYYSRIYDFNYFYLKTYLKYFLRFVPFLVVGGVGAVLNYKKKMTHTLVFVFAGVLFGMAFYKYFGFRYIYIAFFPVVILASVAISKIKWAYVITGFYLLWASNLFYQTNVFLLTPGVDHFDATMPRANFRELYEELGEVDTLVATYTPAAEWYYRAPDYWIYFHFTVPGTPMNETYLAINGTEFYTGAKVITTLEELKNISNATIVFDAWSSTRLDEDINYYMESCEDIVVKTDIKAVRCE